MAKERIGILGGTFNPIHLGHIAMARAAMESAQLDRVLFLPDSVPPHKTGIAPGEDRSRMVCAAVTGEAGFEPCRMELDREGTTYTFDTLTRLREKLPKAELFYIIGADTLMELRNWHRYEEVLRLCTFLVCPRPTSCAPEAQQQERRRLTALGGSFQSVGMEVVDISSTALREALAEDTLTPLLSPVVREYAGLCGLYSGAPRIPQHETWMPRLFSDLNLRRFQHTLGVAYTARNLARAHRVDVARAETAALLHDCAKCMPLREMQTINEANRLTADPSLAASGSLLHAIVGAWMAREVYGVEDAEILTAISRHTTGEPGMSRLDLVVYLADKIEPTRASYPLLDKVRMMAPLSLERAVLTAMEGTTKYVSEKGKPVHPTTLATIDWLKTQV